jgi:hypothetical protein
MGSLGEGWKGLGFPGSLSKQRRELSPLTFDLIFDPRWVGGGSSTFDLGP